MLADGLREFVESNQYDYLRVADGCFRLRFCGKSGDYTMFAQVVEDSGQILVFTYCPVKVPENRRGFVADYLNRVNYGLLLGCLEMDPEDGEVRSRSAAPVAGGEAGPSVLGPLFDSSFYLIENWVHGLLRVAFGSEEPATAYRTALDALDGVPVGETVSEPQAELTAIEQEVSRLLTEPDGDAE